MSISIKTRQAYAEIDSFLELLNEEQKKSSTTKIKRIF